MNGYSGQHSKMLLLARCSLEIITSAFVLLRNGKLIT